MNRLTKFIIITNGRSGSNYFVDIMNQHPNTFNCGEILGEWSKKRYFRKLFLAEEYYVEFWINSGFVYWLSQVFYFFKLKPSYKIKRRKDVYAIGFKDFAINIERLNLAEWLQENEEIKIINLHRENQLERYISLCAMRKTGVVISKNEELGSDRLKIDLKDMMANLKVFEEEKLYHKELIDTFENNRVFDICYEDFFESNIDKSLVIREMFKFIGVEPVKVEERHKKILSKKLKDRIDNFEEVEKTLLNTKYEKYLRR